MKIRLYSILVVLIAASFIVNIPVQAKIAQEPAAEKAGSTISGTVRDADGDPMSDVTIRLVEVKYMVYLPLVVRNAAAADLAQYEPAENAVYDFVPREMQTNGDGYYSFTNVPEGKYQIIPDPYGEKTFDPLTRVVSVPGDASGQDFIQNDLVEIENATTFWMGCDENHLENNDNVVCEFDELPLHQVTVSPYYIDKTEVTNYQYAQCVAAGVCEPPNLTGSKTRLPYYGEETYEYYPVINVTWYDAQTYCNWAGKRLPTEAEWELAARGETPQAYPWGNGPPDCTLANHNHETTGYCVPLGDTDQVGTHTGTSTFSGAEDMAGNVKEWVYDWYDDNPWNPTYYSISPSFNPTGPASGSVKVVRGGSYENQKDQLLTAARHFWDPDLYDNQTGFRCVLPKN